MGVSIPLKSVVIAYGYNTNARIGHCLNHCLGLETLPETFHPCLVTIHSRCHVSHRHSQLAQTKVQHPDVLAEASVLPRRVDHPPSEKHSISILAENLMPKESAINLHEPTIYHGSAPILREARSPT